MYIYMYDECMICNIINIAIHRTYDLHISVEHAPAELDVPVVDVFQRFAGVTQKALKKYTPENEHVP